MTLLGYAPLIGALDHQVWFSFRLVLLLVTVFATAQDAMKGGLAMLVHSLAGGYFVNLTSGLMVGA
jgi:hypothetical protein